MLGDFAAGTEPVTEDDFRSSLRWICGSDCGVAEPRWLSRFGNAMRLAERYRSGRVLLAGDAAHIHFPAAGQGLNTGLQDAMNLGWKLAAEVHGWAPPGLLDTYHSERHPVGRAVTENTEAQTLLAELTLVTTYQRPAAVLRGLLDELLGMEVVKRHLAGEVSALSTSYPSDSPAADPLVWQRMPDIALNSGTSAATRVYELLHEGRFALLDLSGAQTSDICLNTPGLARSAPTPSHPIGDQTERAPYVVLREAVSPSYGSPTQGHRVWLKKLCRLWLSVIGRPVPHDDSALA